MNASTANMPKHGSLLSILVSLILNVRTRLPITAWIHYNIASEVEFNESLGLAIIPYWSLFRNFLKSWRINSDPWSFVIYVGIIYLVNHVVSAKFVIDISDLSLYCVILNHPVTESIMVTAFRYRFYFFPFINIM